MTPNLPRESDTFSDVPMKATTVRFGDAQWRFIAAQAKTEGVSAGQFIREAAFARALLLWALTAPTDDIRTLGKLSGTDVEELIARARHLFPEDP